MLDSFCTTIALVFFEKKNGVRGRWMWMLRLGGLDTLVQLRIVYAIGTSTKTQLLTL